MKKQKTLKQAMTDAGMKKVAQTQNDFFAKYGITAIKVGKQTLKIEKEKK